MTNHNVDDLGPLKAFVDAAGADPSPDQVSKAQNKLMSRLMDQSQKAEKLSWWPRMSLVSATAAAAAVFVFISLWPTEQQLALASVVDKLSQITSYRSVTTTTQGEQVLNRVTSDYREPGQVRIELSHDLSMILDLPNAALLSLDHQQKRYRISELGQPGTFDLNSQASFQFLDQLKQIETDADTILPRQQVDGIWSVGFVVTINGTTMTLWADEATGMPVSLEVTSPLGESQTLETHIQYAFDVSFPDDHFSLEAPEGYQPD